MPRRARDRYIAARLRVRRRASSACAGAILAIRMGPNSLKAALVTVTLRLTQTTADAP